MSQREKLLNLCYMKVFINGNSLKNPKHPFETDFLINQPNSGTFADENC